MTYKDAKFRRDYGKPTIAPSAIQARIGIASENDGVYDVEPSIAKGYSVPTAIEGHEGGRGAILTLRYSLEGDRIR